MSDQQTLWVVDHRDALKLMQAAEYVAQERINEPTQMSSGPVAIDVTLVAHDGSELIPAATLRMSAFGAPTPAYNVALARNKSLTALNFASDTIVYERLVAGGTIAVVELVSLQAACPYFTPVGGGVLGYKEGCVVVAVAVSGLSSEGDDAIAREALRMCGYETHDPADSIQAIVGDPVVGRTAEDLWLAPRPR
jgi:uncharacterized protein GlcG (DUF336 family)